MSVDPGEGAAANGDQVVGVGRVVLSPGRHSSTPMYVGTLSILRKPRNGLSYETLLATVEQRLPQIPRYRQKVREVTLGLARPVWIDDRDFDITYHIRTVGAAVAGQRCAAASSSSPRLGSRPAGQVAAAVGDVSDRGPGPQPHRDLHQVAPGTGERHDGARDRPRHRRSHAQSRRSSARTSGSLRASRATVSLLLGAVGEWIARPAEPRLAAVASAVDRGGDQRGPAGRGRPPSPSTSRVPSRAAPRRAAR